MSAPVSPEVGLAISFVTVAWAFWVCHDDGQKWWRWFALAMVYLSGVADGCAIT